MRFSMGTSALSKISVRVDEPFNPILRSSAPVETPGKFLSTRKQLKRFPSTCAKVTKTSAKAAFVIHIFSPLRIQWDPSGLRTADAFAASASDPLDASERAYAESLSPLQSTGRYFLFRSSVPKYTIGRVPIPA